MLGKAHKLSSVEFKKVYDGELQIHTPHLFIKYLKNQDSFKAAAVVSKKHTKTAIGRNLKRRVIYNAVKNTALDQNIDSVWMIVMLKKQSIHVSYSEIVADMNQALAKLAK